MPLTLATSCVPTGGCQTLEGGRADTLPHGMQVQESADVSLGGIMLPDSAREKPIAGRIVRVGPGKREKDGSRKAPKLKEGDAVLYFKWAGDQMETPSGEKFVVVHESDVLCKT